MKSILLAVADPQSLDGIAQALGAGWEATSVCIEADAFAQLEKRSFDAVLVDFNLGPADGSVLLNHALRTHPATFRFLLAYEADLALVAAKVLGQFQILAKPVEFASLKNIMERAMAPADSSPKTVEREQSDNASDSPATPSIYAEALQVLNTPEVTIQQVAEIIAQDEKLATELLALTHSAYPGVARDLTDPAEAVGSLGLESVKALVLALKYLAENSKLRPGYLSLDQLWRHSTHVARLARDLVLMETKDRALASEALAAGLLHDLGKVVLATNFDDMYGRVHSLARKQPVALWDIEKEIFGASHGEVGGCLVGMWNVPYPIVEAVAFHHEPPKGEQQDFTPLAAVHIANALEHGIRPGNEGFVAPMIDTAFLNELGLLQRLPVWRAVIANGPLADHGPELEPVEPGLPESSVALPSSAPTRSARPRTHANNPQLSPATEEEAVRLPAASARDATPDRPSSRAGRPAASTSCSRRHRRRWAYVGAAVAGLLSLLGVWFESRSEVNPPVLVYAQTPATNEVPELASSTPPPPPQVTAPEPEPEAALAATVPEPVPATPAPATPAPAATDPDSASSLPETEPTAATTSEVIASNAPSASPMPEQKAPTEFRISGVIYSGSRPSAFVNGHTVFVGDFVSGATVIAIDRTSVTLQIDGQPKTYGIR